ncbi:MAG TPA: RNA polymerase sigma factor [Candidatus Pygmaiobacter gallistercoris]|nr:RNA polymerase sigma factor [Candidatus Pygmaiobacter gallistercoris]
MTDGAFEQLVTDYQRLIYTICRQMVKDPDTAEDLVQETFLSAYLHREQCTPETVRPWLCRIAVNKAKDYLKSAWRRKVDPGGETAEDATPLPSAETLALDRVSAQRIEGLIRALHEPYLKVSVLYFLEQQPVEEIARRLRRPSKTVHTQLYRAKRLLQQKLNEGGI